MKCLWTWSGKSFGYREGDELWTHDGNHAGRFDGDAVCASYSSSSCSRPPRITESNRRPPECHEEERLSARVPRVQPVGNSDVRVPLPPPLSA